MYSNIRTIQGFIFTAGEKVGEFSDFLKSIGDPNHQRAETGNNRPNIHFYNCSNVNISIINGEKIRQTPPNLPPGQKQEEKEDEEKEEKQDDEDHSHYSNSRRRNKKKKNALRVSNTGNFQNRRRRKLSRLRNRHPNTQLVEGSIVVFLKETEEYFSSSVNVEDFSRLLAEEFTQEGFFREDLPIYVERITDPNDVLLLYYAATEKLNELRNGNEQSSTKVKCFLDIYHCVSA